MTTTREHIRDLLVNNSALTAVVAAKDIGSPRASRAIPRERGSVVFAGNGGDTDAVGLVRDPSWTVMCYANTAEDAMEVYELVKVALIGTPDNQPEQRATWATYGIHSALPEQEPQEPPIEADGPDKGIPMVLGFFTVTFLGVT